MLEKKKIKAIHLFSWHFLEPASTASLWSSSKTKSKLTSWRCRSRRSWFVGQVPAERLLCAAHRGGARHGDAQQPVPPPPPRAHQPKSSYPSCEPPRPRRNTRDPQSRCPLRSLDPQSFLPIHVCLETNSFVGYFTNVCLPDLKTETMSDSLTH